MTFYAYLSCIIVGLLLSLFFFFFKRKYQLNEKSHDFIFFIISYVLSFELYAFFLVEHGEKNVLVYNIFFVFGETILILIYLGTLIEAKRIKRNVIYFLALFVVWAIINTLFIQAPTQMFQQYTHLLGSLGVVLFSCYLMYSLFMADKAGNASLLSMPHFWNIAAILFFYSGSFIYFGSLNVTWGLDEFYLTILASVNRFFAATLYLIFGFSYYSPLIFSTKSD
ncbi:hypothetical protein Cycma_1428 [Cyclobacterium marinum DSM 745]|uniref:Histidine kinase N-terminal 7TM region domain-containing protein n=1 Tax=Cyclobacterium marinum (strain ATCC 25205 / DSM 745 / LMG 13164 / NCIMB 1802) TaxID=880070 RepID=G0J2C3_CYCMS|nr:hypothetical protein Cycma_1428 [Cyclobacterium marinum DSM 745]